MAKICMVAYTFYQSDARVRREAEALVGRGDALDFICVQDPKNSAHELNGVNLYPLRVGRYQGASTLRYILIYLSFLVRSAALLTRLYLSKRYDVIHVHTMPDFLVFSAMIPKILGAKVILDVHDLMPELYICKFGKSDNFFVRLITWIEKRSIAFAHRAIAVSIPHRNALVDHGNPLDKFSVVLNVPDPAIFDETAGAINRISDGRFRLIYHGTVARRHGLEVALRAVRSIRNEIPNLEFLVIGHGDDMERIKALASELHLMDCVRFQGRVPVDQLPQYLRTADLGIIPLLLDEFTRYMLPLKLMEYVHLGIPAVVTRTDTIQTYFDDSMVRFIPSGDERELARVILELARDPEKRSLLAKNANRFNERYNWTAQKQGLFDLVDSLTQVKNTKIKAEILCQ